MVMAESEDKHQKTVLNILSLAKAHFVEELGSRFADPQTFKDAYRVLRGAFFARYADHPEMQEAWNALMQARLRSLLSQDQAPANTQKSDGGTEWASAVGAVRVQLGEFNA